MNQSNKQRNINNSQNYMDFYPKNKANFIGKSD